MDLTIASYNLHGGVGWDGKFDLRRIRDVLREVSADVVALQECGDFRAPPDSTERPEQLAEWLGFHMAFAPNVVQGTKRYGNALLSRLPIRRSHNYDLTVSGKEPRGALLCDFDVGGGRLLHVFCLHLGLSPRERRAQEALLLSAEIWRDAARRDPVIVCGDFNYFWNGPVPALVRSSIRDAAHELGEAGRTYPARLPLLRLDRFFVAGSVRPLAVRVHRTPLAAEASDHLPVVMRFEVPEIEHTPFELHPVRRIG